MASRVIAIPDWNTLPVPLTSPWYDSPKVRQVASGGFALLGVVFGAPFYFTASLSRFLLLGLAVASFVVARRMLATPQDKNAIGVVLRQKAGADVEQSGTFKDFQTKYRDLISQKILQPTDVNFVIERDVQVLDYAPFLAKHADASCKKALIDALEPASRELLKAKCLAMLVANPAQVPDEADKALLDRKPPRVNEQALVAKDWNELLQNGGQFAGVTDPAAVEARKRLFLAKAYRREIDPRNTDYYFPEEEERKFIKTTMVIFELELVADGQLPFSELKWCEIGGEEIVDYFPQMNPAKQGPLKQKLVEHYLTTLSSDQLKSEGFKRRREACGILFVMIENAQGSVRSDCQRLSYRGPGGFREKYGNKHLNDGSLTPELLDKIKVEFRADLPAAGSISREIYDDALILGLGEEILVPRWLKMPLKDLWNKEKEIFYDYCRKNSAAIPTFKQKMIEDLKNLSIFEILSVFNGILRAQSLFLRPADQSASGKTFAELAEEAVEKAGKLGAVILRADYTVHRLVDDINFLFGAGLLSPASPALRRVIKASLDEHGAKIFESPIYCTDLHHPQVIWGKMGGVWSTVNGQVGAFYNSACLEVRQAQEKLEAAKTRIDREQFESEAQTARKEKGQAVSRRLEAIKKEKEEIKGSRRWDAARAVLETGDTLHSKQQELITLQSVLRGLPDIQSRLKAQIATLEAQSAPDGKLLIEATQSLQTLRSNLQDQQKQYDRQLSEDAGKKAQESKIAQLREQKRAADEAGKPTLDVLHEIVEQILSVGSLNALRETTLNAPFLFPNTTPAPDMVSKTQLIKEIEADSKKLEELQKQRAEAELLHRLFGEKSLEAEKAVYQAVWNLKTYVKDLEITKQLEAAKEKLEQKEKEHRLLTEQFEIFANRGEILKKLRANLAALPAEIEKCRADIGIAEVALRKAKGKHGDAHGQEHSLTQQELAIDVEIQQLEAELTKLSRENQSNPEKTAFEAGKKDRKDKLDAAYQTFVKERLTTFEKMLLPELS